MERNEALKLRTGDRVVYARGTVDEAHGTVTGVFNNAVNFAWDDGVMGATHTDDMANMTREDPAAYRDLMTATRTLAGYYLAVLKVVPAGALDPAVYQNVNDDAVTDIIRDMLDHARRIREA